ncbi:MAG: undecaprenyl-diphosphate phosphatase [Candidatus Omnitrophica bacterium]|nr:undecaprenyl-diphosphate phosphatase [Candidatus Omnitrophota bacterium]
MKFLFFGVIQGLTEFLPVSSSGHLYFLKRVLGLNEDLLSFFIFLHLATLFAMLLFFSKEIQSAVLKKKLLLYIFIITGISGFFGLIIKYFFSSFFDDKYLLSFCFFINAVILLSARRVRQKRDSQSITLKDSFILGILQGVSIFPGISRSGITITGLLRRGLDARQAFNLSFLMAIPVILLAFFAEFKELSSCSLKPSYLISGFICAFFCGMLALKILKKILISGKFHNFGYYGLIVFIISLSL